MFVSALSFGLALLPFSLAATIDVQVGQGGSLLYEPEAIYAAPGDTVVFHFHPKNHTVTQSSFADPCGRMEGGFNSGFQPVAAGSTDIPTVVYEVTNSDPTWFYCAQAARTPNSHCGKGMVFSINCGPDGAPNSFANFKASALAIGASLEAAASSAPATSTTAAYGDLTIPAAPEATLVTETITLSSSTWTTTYSSYPGSPDPTPSSLEGETILVKVGANGLTFDPPSVEARPRDKIEFQFLAKNHTVTQSSFEDPCRPLAGGFSSGFQPVPAGTTDFPTYVLEVNGTEPIYAYCAQGNHCGQGMLFTVNVAEDSPRNPQAFKNVAQTLNGTSAASTADESEPTNHAIGYGPATGMITLFTLGLIIVGLL